MNAAYEARSGSHETKPGRGLKLFFGRGRVPLGGAAANWQGTAGFSAQAFPFFGLASLPVVSCRHVVKFSSLQSSFPLTAFPLAVSCRLASVKRFTAQGWNLQRFVVMKKDKCGYHAATKSGNSRAIVPDHHCILKKSEAASFLSVSVRTLERLIAEGIISKVVISPRRVGVRNGDLMRYVEMNTTSSSLRV